MLHTHNYESQDFELENHGLNLILEESVIKSKKYLCLCFGY